MDGFGSHSTKKFIDYCDQYEIILFCLPLYSSHLLQPLDIVIFQSYKHYHSKAVEAATQIGYYRDFYKCEFLDQIDSIRQQTFWETTVKSLFKAAGLIFYDPAYLISKL